MKKIILSFFLLIGLSELNGENTEVKINDFNQLGGNGTKITALEQKILNIIDEFRKRMCHELKFGDFELPVLDPFKLKSFELPIQNFEIARVANLDVKGLSDISIENFKFSTMLLKLTGQIKLDRLNLTTKYKIKGKISNIFQVDGEGHLSLDVGTIIDFDIRLKVNAETKKLFIGIPKLEPTALNFIAFNITGIFPEDELNKLIEDMVNDIGPELFNDIWQDNKNYVIELLELLATDPVKDMFPKDLLDLIGSDEPIFGEEHPKPDCKD